LKKSSAGVIAARDVVSLNKIRTIFAMIVRIYWKTKAMVMMPIFSRAMNVIFRMPAPTLDALLSQE